MEVQGPVGIDPGRAIPPLEQMSGRQLLDAVHQRMRTGNVIERQVVVQAGEIEGAWDLGVAEERFQLRAEVDIGAAPMEVKRLDPQTVPRQHETPARLRPEPDGKHAPQTREALDIPLLERVQNDFGVAMSPEPMPQGFQLSPQLGVIVDLTVEDNNGIAVLAAQRLVAATQVDDLEANRAQ